MHTEKLHEIIRVCKKFVDIGIDYTFSNELLTIKLVDDIRIKILRHIIDLFLIYKYKENTLSNNLSYYDQRKNKKITSTKTRIIDSNIWCYEYHSNTDGNYIFLNKCVFNYGHKMIWDLNSFKLKGFGYKNMYKPVCDLISKKSSLHLLYNFSAILKKTCGDIIVPVLRNDGFLYEVTHRIIPNHIHQIYHYHIYEWTKLL